MTAQPGWYENAAGPLRWWDGRHWTGPRVKDGVPGVDRWVTEPPSLAWISGFVFLVLGAAQLALALSSGSAPVSAVLMLAVAALGFSTAVPSTLVRRIPAPAGAPVAPEVVRPLPGEVEADGAGWYPLSPTVTRWWTGARWSQYVHSRAGVRPTFHGPYARRVLRIMTLVVFVLAAAALAVGAALIVFGPRDADGVIFSVLGWIVAVSGVLFAVLGVVVAVMTAQQSKLLLLPKRPPRALSR